MFFYLRQLLLRQKIFHAVQRDSQRGDVVEHSRCCRRDEPKHACTNESGVDAYDGAVVGVDPLHETVTELLECHQFIQVICANGDVGNFTSQLCAITDSNANIRCRKSRRIVDPVSDHNGFGSVFRSL